MGADTMRTCAGECFKQPLIGGPVGTIMKITLPVNPASHDGDRFIDAARATLKELEMDTKNACHKEGLRVTFYLADAEGTVLNHDMMRLTFGEFKRNLPITVCLIFIMIGVYRYWKLFGVM